MKTKITKRHLYLLAALIGFTLTCSPAFAQSLGLAPAQVVEKFKPGVPFEFDLSTVNTGETPVDMTVEITDFTSTTATIKVFASTNFAHPTILQARDGAASAGPFNNIGLTAGTATQITAAAADRSSITRFLGLFISNINGPTSLRGSDNATLTFTMTVP